MQALLLLPNAHVDLPSSVKRAIVEESQELPELLDRLGFGLGDRSDEFVVGLDFHHERGQFQIQ